MAVVRVDARLLAARAGQFDRVAEWANQEAQRRDARIRELLGLVGSGEAAEEFRSGFVPALNDANAARDRLFGATGGAEAGVAGAAGRYVKADGDAATGVQTLQGELDQ